MQVKIQKQTYELRYKASFVADAEDEMGISVGRAFNEGVRLRQVAALVRAGIRYQERKLLTAQVLDRIEDHLEHGGKLEKDILWPVMISLAEAGFLGDNSDPELMRRRMFGDEDGGPKEEQATG